MTPHTHTHTHREIWIHTDTCTHRHTQTDIIFTFYTFWLIWHTNFIFSTPQTHTCTDTQTCTHIDTHMYRDIDIQTQIHWDTCMFIYIHKHAYRQICMWEIYGNYYFKSTVKVKFAKITLKWKSKKIVTVNPLLSQNKQNSLL